jgi:hypothetical protein
VCFLSYLNESHAGETLTDEQAVYMGNAVKQTQGRIFMKGKHEKKQFSALLALALCVLITVTFMPSLMFSSRADDSKTVSQITPPSSTSLTVSAGTSVDEVKAKLPSSLSAKVTQGDQTEADETIDGITWSSDQYDANKAGTYTFTSALPSGYKLADGVSMPSVSVTVSAGTKKSDNDPLNSKGKSYTKNNTRNAFLSSDIFGNYSNSLNMGAAGYFHVVAFNQATLNAHTNGNILTHILEANRNFGTDRLGPELSYIQECNKIQSSSVPDDNDILVFGSKNSIGTMDHDNYFTVNETKLDRPKTIIQDADTEGSPYIDLNNLKTKVKEGQNKLAAHYKNVNAEYKSDNDGQSIVCSGTGTAYYNMTATEFNNLSNRTGDHTLKITGLDKESRQALVININCQGVDSISGPDGSGFKVFIGDQEVNKDETTDFSGGRVILNFYNTTENTNINLGQVCCQVIAPNANLTITNGNGNFIANNVTIAGETHRMDFTGNIDESSNPKLNFSVKKTFDGDWSGKTGKTFNFVLNGKDNAPMPEKGTVSVKSEGVSAENKNKTASFGDITFTDAGIYQYTIKEDIPSDAENNVSGGVKYDSTIYDIEVVTTKDSLTNKVSISSVRYKKHLDPESAYKDLNTSSPAAFEFTNSSVGTEENTTDITVNKVWKDENGNSISAPENSSVTVQLQQKVEGTNDFSNVDGKTLTLNKDNEWTGKFENLPKKEDGNTVEYQVIETGVEIDGKKVDNYSSSVSDIKNGSCTVTNTEKETTPTSATATLYVTKNLINGTTKNASADWNGKSFKFKLTSATGTPMPDADEVTIDENSKNSDDGIYTASFGTINYENAKPGDTYVYNIKEEGNANTDSNISYDDAEYRATVTINKDMSTTVTYSNAKLTEATPDSTANPGSAVFNNTITSPKPDTTISVNGTKTWDDNNNQDGKRPESITLNLYADGTKTKSETIKGDANSNSWSYTFTDLPKMKDGKEINYTVQEEPVDGVNEYKSSGIATKDNKFTITNTHNPETTTISGTKTWSDNNSQDGNNHPMVTIYLLANGTERESKTLSDSLGWSYSFDNLPVYANGEKINYTITEDAVTDYTPVISGYNIENKYTPGKTSVTVTKSWNDDNNSDKLRPSSVQVQLYDNDDKIVGTATLNTENNWSYTWTELDKDKTYHVKEVSVPDGYTSSVTGSDNNFTITNTHKPDTPTPTYTTYTVHKVWNLGDGQTAPDSVQMQLYKNGVAYGSPVTVTKNSDWTYTWTRLPQTENGKLNTWTVKEVDPDNQYTATVVNGTSSATVTNRSNSNAGGKTQVSVHKVWKLDDGRTAASSVQAQLYRNGEAYGDPVTLSAGNHWSYLWTGLTKTDAQGNTISWTVREVNVPSGFTSTVTGTDRSFTITNDDKPQDNHNKHNNSEHPNNHNNKNNKPVHPSNHNKNNTTVHPGTPTIPKNTGKTAVHHGIAAGGTPRTGDQTSLGFWLAMLLAGAAGT